MEYIDTSSIKFDLKIDCNWHAQLQGEVPNECMKIQVTAVSAETEPIVELYALNSRSIPLEDHEGSWSQLIPTWRFVDEYDNVVTRLPIHTRQHPIYTNIVTGEANVKYVDDSPSEIGKPILLLATMSLTGYPLDVETIHSNDSDNVITHPGYSNSKITKVHVMEINETSPIGLRISRNGIEPLSSQTYWANQFIPCVVTVEGWQPEWYNVGDIGTTNKHITIYDYPYDPNITVPLTGFIYAKETGIPDYDIETSGTIYTGNFRLHSNDENMFRTGGYTTITAIPQFESGMTVISACVEPISHEYRPWTMGKSWVAFSNSDTPSTVAYFYPAIDDTIKGSEINHLVNNVSALFNIDTIPYVFTVPIPNTIGNIVPGANSQNNNINTGGTGVFAMDMACNTWLLDCELGTLTKLNRNHKQIGDRINLTDDVNNSTLTAVIPNFNYNNHLSPNNIWLSVDNKLITTCFTDHIVTIHDAITHEMCGCIYTPPAGKTETSELYPNVNNKPMDSQGRPVAAIIEYHGTSGGERNTKDSTGASNQIYVLYESFFSGYGDNRINSSLIQFEISPGTHIHNDISSFGYDIYSENLNPISFTNLVDLNGKNIIDVMYYNEYMYILSEDYSGDESTYFNNNGYLTVIPMTNEGAGTPRTVALVDGGHQNILHPDSICIKDEKPKTSSPGDPITILFTGYTRANSSVNAGVFKYENLTYADLTSDEMGELNTTRIELKTLESKPDGNIGRYVNNPQAYTKALNGLALDYDNQIWLVDNISGQLKVYHDLNKEPAAVDFPKVNNNSVEGIAHGDWNGSRQMLNFFHQEFAPRIFHGESEPFIVDSYTNYKIRKHNDSWHVVDRMEYATDVAPFKENTNFFNRYIGAALGGERVHGSYSVARKLYERIANAVPNIHDVDECGMDELHSLGISQDVPMDMFTPHYPEELKRLMDIFSVSHEKLWGDRCKCDSFYFEAPGQYNNKNIPQGEEDDYNPKRFCPICKHFHGTNLGQMISNTNEIKLDVENHPPYVVRSRYNKRYIKIEPSITSIADASALLNMMEDMTGDDSRKTPQYNAMVQLLVKIDEEKQNRHEGKYEECPIWSSFLYRYGPVQTTQTDIPDYCITSEFNDYYNHLEEIEPLSSFYVPEIDEELTYIYGNEGSSIKEMANLKDWISIFQSPVTPNFDIANLPQSVTRNLLILKFTIDNLSTFHDRLVAVHTSMFTPEPWYNYCIYHYIPTQCGHLNTSVINWDDSMNSLSESASGLDDWYQEDGIVENMLAYVIRKGLGFESTEVAKYMIFFYANGGYGSMDIQTIPRNVEQTLSECKFVRAGYVFDGWATSPTGKVIYRDKQSVNNLLEAHEVITLYAHWKKLPSLAITFEPNGGTGYSYTQEIPMFTSAELAPIAFTSNTSAFSGWAITSTGEVELSDLEIVYNPFDTDVTSTLYARWYIPNTENSNGDAITYLNG